MFRFFLCGIFFLAGLTCTHACGPYDRLYEPEQYYTFRICGDNMNGCTPQFPQQQSKDIRNEICKTWQRQTSRNIPIKDIEVMVFHWNIRDLQNESPYYQQQAAKKNAFFRWIMAHKDSALMQYLVLAQAYENIRSQQNSAWYYPSEYIESTMSLADIARQAAAYKGRRWADRYALLHIRALFSSYQNDECINTWTRKKHLFKKGLLRNMAEGYVAGIYYRMGKIDRATNIYWRIGDIASLIFINKGYQKDALAYNADINPNDSRLRWSLQNAIHNLEAQDDSGGWDNETSKQQKEILRIAKSVIRDKRTKNRAIWYYAAALMENKLGKDREAWQHIQKASACRMDKELRDAIHVYAIYARVKLARHYDAALEKYLYNELQWLDGKIKANLTPKIRSAFVKNGVSFANIRYSLYYWNDMLRKIILSEVAPLCIKSGYRVRALQYLNMADNYLLQIVGRKEIISKCDFEFGSITGNENPYAYNAHDYRNDYFINLDSLGSTTIKHLIYKIKHPQCALDSFLLKRGYSDMQYLYGIMGTQMLASMRYAEAVRYLDKVSARFQASRNYIADSEDSDPFSVRGYKRNKKADNLCKLHFAQKMLALEKTMNHAKNPNARAEAMLQYVRGLQNSISHCWYLTCYYKGAWECYPFYSRHQRKLTDSILNRSLRLKKKAFCLFTDKERAAKAYYAWSMFKSAATLCPNTRYGKYVRGHCDQLKDYSSLHDLNSGAMHDYW